LSVASLGMVTCFSPGGARECSPGRESGVTEPNLSLSPGGATEELLPPLRGYLREPNPFLGLVPQATRYRHSLASACRQLPERIPRRDTSNE